MDVVVLALACELDFVTQRVFAFLQNDVTRRRPSVELALELRRSSVQEKLARQASFAPDAPLLRHGLIELLPEAGQVRPPLIAHAIDSDDQIVRLLLGQRSLDARLVHCCERRAAVAIDDLPADGATRNALLTLSGQIRDGRPALVYLQGPFRDDKRRIAEVLAWSRRRAAPDCDFSRRLLRAIRTSSVA